METPVQEREISKFNEAGYGIMRLHEIWQRIENHATKGELVKWRWLLDSVWRELYSDVLRMDKSDKIIEENKQLLKLINTQAPKPSVVGSASSGVVSLTFYNLLNKRHEFLKKIQDDAGKGGSYKDADDEDFD